jgi:hypothetical protein
MTAGKKAGATKGKVKKLTLKKETLKDLKVKKSEVKGGAVVLGVSGSDTQCMISCYQQCRTRGVDCNSRRGCTTGAGYP